MDFNMGLVYFIAAFFIVGFAAFILVVVGIEVKILKALFNAWRFFVGGEIKPIKTKRG